MKKDAVVGEAEAKRDSTIAEAKANEQKMQASKEILFFNIIFLTSICDINLQHHILHQFRQNFQMTPILL